jgi:hypothetical protein
MTTPRARDRGPRRLQTGTRLAITDGCETVGYVVEAGDHGTYPTLAGASRSFPGGGAS